MEGGDFIMSTTIDSRIVEMKLDNDQFEGAATKSVGTLDRLKQALRMDGASKGFDEVSSKAKSVDLSKLESGVNTLAERFTVLKTVAIGVMSNIATQALNTASTFAKSFTLQPITDGFHEYETQMDAVQTILANTASKGSTIKDVNESLAQLNTYADKTIYNFTEMTRNIGTFTAAGVDLKTSTEAIKGIANLAAVSGSNSQQASTAMYQLSQALATGTVKLMDWNSVVNAGMGGQVFQDALVRTSEHLKTGAKAAISAKGSFRESLQTGWLTSQVLTETLNQFQLSVDSAEDYNNAIKSLVSQGYTQEEAKAIADMAKTAGDAATKVKTFSQLIDTLKEAAGSGWTTSFQTILGDFEEARETWTGFSDILSKALNDSANARNQMLEGWSKLGGRKELFGGLLDSLKMIASWVGPIKDGFRDIIPSITSQQLFAITKGFHNLVDSLTLSTDQMKMLRETVRNFLSPLGLLKDGIMAIFHMIMKSAPSAGSSINVILVVLNKLSQVVAFTTDVVRGFFTGFDHGIQKFSVFGGLISSVTDYFKSMHIQVVDLSGALDVVAKKLTQFATAAGEKIGQFAKALVKGLSTAINWIKDNISLGDVFGSLIGAGTVITIKKLIGLIGSFQDVIEKISNLFSKGGKGLKSGAGMFNEVLEQLKGSLQAFTQGIKATSLLAIAGSIMLLAKAMQTISNIEPGKIVYSLGAMSAMFIMLNLSLKSMTKSLMGFEGKGMISAGIALLAMAKAINMLGDAMSKIAKIDVGGIAKGLVSIQVLIWSLTGFVKGAGNQKVILRTSVALLALAKSIQMITDSMATLSSMSWEDLARGMVGFAGSLGGMILAIKQMDSMKVSPKTSIALLAIAQASKMLSESLSTFAGLSWQQIAQGLTAMGGALAELTGTLKLLSMFSGKGSISGAVSLLIAVQSLNSIAKAMASIGSISWNGIAKGLSGIGVALGEFTLVLKVLSKFNGIKSIASAVALVTLSYSLANIGKALASIGSLSWNSIAKGLTGMVVALTAMGVVLGLLGTVAPVGSIAAAAAILIAAQSLDKIADALFKMGLRSWNSTAKGLVAMGVALTELGVIIGLLGTVAPVGSLVGAAAILVVSKSLGDIALALMIMGSMSWSGIAKGLIAMGAALTELGLVIGILGTVAPVGALAGAAAILVAAKGLLDIAKVLQTLGSMSWAEIQKGLAAMAAAMGAVGLGALMNTFSGFGASAIATMAKPLGDLADSMKKWSNVRVPDDLADSMDKIADGVSKFMWGAWGADSLAKAAPGLGQMADAMSKWKNVKVPGGLEAGLTSISNGVKSFTWAFMGGWSIGAAIGPLGDLAGAIKKWNGISVPKDLESCLTSISNGVKSFTWAFVGGWSLSAITSPLGDLAGAISKWSGVYIPDGIDKGLTSIADGMKAFTWAAAGGFSLNAVVEPLGNLAGAVDKWSGVSVPTDLKQGLWDIKDGVSAFGEKSIDPQRLSGIVGPIGTLASSVSKWQNVKVPKDLKQGLWDIKDGVSAFGEKSIDGTRMNGIVKPLGDLAASAGKWTGISVPKNLKQILWDIKDGAAPLADVDGGKMSAIVDPLGNLAGSIAKWVSVKVPAGMKQALWDIKDGAAPLADVDGGKINAIIQPLGNLAASVTKWADVKAPDGLKQSLWDIKDGAAPLVDVDGDHISTLVTPLSQLAGSIQQWTDVTVPPDLKQALWDLKDGAAPLADVDGAKMAAIVTPLGDLAGSIGKWSGITAPDNLKDILWAIKDGAAPLADVDGAKMATVVTPLGDLSDAVRRWAGVTTPDNLKQILWDLKDGAAPLADVDGGKMSTIVTPLGDLSDAIRRWNGVTVPDNLKQILWDIKDGAAPLADVDGGKMSAIAGPLGNLSDSVRKWNGVTVPDNLKQILWDIKDGAAPLADVDGGKMAAIAGPLGTLSDSVRKWAGVAVPDNLKQILWDIKDGAAPLADVDGGKMSAIVGPLGNMSDSVRRWSDVTIPAGLKQGLWDIKDGVGAFGDLGESPTAMSTASSSLEKMATAASSAGAADMTAVGGQLVTMGNSISTFGATAQGAIPSMGEAAKALTSLGNSSSTAIGQMSGLGTSFTNFGNVSSAGIDQVTGKLNGIPGFVNTAKGSISSIEGTASAVANAMTTSFNAISSTVSTNLASAQSTISSYNSKFSQGGTDLAKNLQNGMKNGLNDIKNTFNGSLNDGVDSVRSTYGSYYSAGKYIAEGLANGIDANRSKPVNAAAAMGKAAVDAANKAAGVASPSKLTYKTGMYLDMGAANGLEDYGYLVNRSALKMSDSVVGAISDTLKNAQTVADSGLSYSPRITPVLDLDSMKNGMNQVSGMMANSDLSIMNGSISLPSTRYQDPQIQALAQYQDQLLKSNAQFTQDLQGLREDMSSYTDAAQNQVVRVDIDGKAVAEATVKPINQKMGIESRRGRLG
jgi:tape measure domain-containing protein